MNSHSACKSGRASRSYDWICGKHKHNFPKKSFLTIFQFGIFRRDSCLLNLNGNNLLGNLVSIPGVTGGGAGGGGGGILGGLLGGK